MVDTSALVKSVVAYKEQRAKVKARQRTDLETECEPWAADVGDEIIKLRERHGKSIADIGAIIGIENRTFIYKMIHASQKMNAGIAAPAPEVESGGNDEHPYTIEFFDSVARVTFAEDEFYDVTVVEGTPDVPEEWSEHTQSRRVLYKDVIKAIRNHNWD